MQAVLSNAMPPGNITEITPEERQVLAGWIADGAQGGSSGHGRIGLKAIRGRSADLPARTGGAGDRGTAIAISMTGSSWSSREG